MSFVNKEDERIQTEKQSSKKKQQLNTSSFQLLVLNIVDFFIKYIDIFLEKTLIPCKHALDMS